MRTAWRRPLGLILAGGGAHGAWQAGVIDRLASAHGLQFDHILGFSIGALNGAGYCFGKMKVLMGVWRRVDRHRIMRLRPRLNPLSLFSDKPMWEITRQGGSETEARAAARCDFTVISYCLEDNEHYYARYSPGGKNGWDAPFSRHLVASCSIPRIFPPVRIRTNGRERTFVDGGVWGPRDVTFQALRGCKDIIAVQMTRPDEIGYRPFLYWNRREQNVREGLNDYISMGLRSLLPLPDRPRIFRFYPSKKLDYDLLAFRERCCADALRQGRGDADGFVDYPERFLV